MRKKYFISFWLLLAIGMSTVVFNSCGKDDEPKKEEANPDNPEEPGKSDAIADNGVMINGVKWATRNVYAPGTFAASPESPGMFYQWNRKTAWPTTGNVTGWDSSTPSGTTWEKSNDPSPSGWRVPTKAEIETLLDIDKVSHKCATQNGVSGRKFTDKASGATLFLPAVGYRHLSYGGALDYGDAFGGYWSSTPTDSSNAYYLYFDSGIAGGSSSRNDIFFLRCVAE